MELSKPKKSRVSKYDWMSEYLQDYPCLEEIVIGDRAFPRVTLFVVVSG